MGLIGSCYNTSSDELGISYKSGYSGNVVGPSRYYFVDEHRSNVRIYNCPPCNRPTYINNYSKEQSSGPMVGNEVAHLPEER